MAELPHEEWVPEPEQHKEEHEHEPTTWERLTGWGNSAMHVAGHRGIEALEGLEHEARALTLGAEGESSMLGRFGPTAAKVGRVFGRYLPWVGTGIGVGQFGYHAHEAANTEDNGSYFNNEHWNHVGEASLGAVGAAASWCPPAALYLGGGELATDALGWASGKVGDGINNTFGTHLDTHFTAGSVVGETEHLMSNFSARNHPLMNGALMGACPAMALAANAGDLVTGSGQVIDSIGHGIGRAGHWAGETASNAYHGGVDLASRAYQGGADLAHRGADHARSMYHTASDTVGSAYHSASNTVGGLYNRATTAAGNTMHNISDTASNAYNSASQNVSYAWNHPRETANNAVNSVSKTASNAWNKVKSWF